MSERKSSCWILTEGMAGTEGQCVGVAAALGVEPEVKRIALKTPWKQLSPWLCFGHRYALSDKSDTVQPPWPDILIASGRKSVGVALDIKKRSGGKTFLVQLQDPRINASHFDLVAVPQHDPTRGENVVVMTGALHRMTKEKLSAASDQWRDKFAHLPSPRVAVLIGGNSKAHKMTQAVTQRLADDLLKIDGGLMITASRRTGEENTALLREKLNKPNIFFWDGAGDNPMLGFLALADYIIVTEDSVSMVSEALFTGKPVYVASLEGGARRLDLFHKLLRDQGYTRPFEGKLESWSYQPFNDVEKVVSEIKKRMEKK